MLAENNNNLMHQPIILLKAGTEASSGRDLILSNIRACKEIVEMVQSTLGPTGQDKLIRVNNKTFITNDGATVLDLLTVIHPAAKLMVDISQSQDAEVGDGTTSVVLLAGELLNQAIKFIENGVNPQLIISSYKKALNFCKDFLNEIAIDLKSLTPEERKKSISFCAQTSLNSKLLANHKEYFSEIAYKTAETLCGHNNSVINKDMIGIKKVSGGSVTESHWLAGVAFKKCFSYAGFENAPKKFTNGCKILLLNLELELKAERENAELRINSGGDYQKMIDAEWKILIEKLDHIVEINPNVVLSRLAIGDIATQYLADRKIFCAGRVDEGDLKRTAFATNGKILTTVNNISSQYLGFCEEFEESQVGNERYNYFKNCPNKSVSTIILRGGANQFIEEAERSLHDAIMVCCRAMQKKEILGGAGSVDMELACRLEKLAYKTSNKQQAILLAFVKALEVIPRTLAINSGLDSLEVIGELRKLHSDSTGENLWMGVNCSLDEENRVMDAVKNYVWEPLIVKLNAYSSAVEAACAVLSVNEMIKNPKSNPEPKSGIKKRN